VFVLVVQGSAQRALAKDVHFAGIPSHDIFPVPSGILFPSLFTAAGVNPAALPQKDKVFGLGVTYSPPINDTQEYSAVLASADKNYGWAVGYNGSLTNSATHGVYLGGGFRSQSTSLGIGLRDSDLNSGTSPQTDIGVIANTGSDVTMGLVLYHIDSSPQLDLGVGFSNQKNYSFEINMLMPELNSLFTPGYDYVFTAATTVYASIFGISFRTSYFTSQSKVIQSVSLMIQLSRSFSLTVQYDSPNRTYYGLNILF
jgi:hypothetical protein